MGMIRSMTGFGKATKRAESGLFIAEIKTLNHKFLDVTPKLSNSMAVFDDRVRGLIKNRVKRGKVYLNLLHEPKQALGANILIDENLAKAYCRKLNKLKKHADIEGTIQLSDIIAFPGVINYKPVEKDIANLWPFVRAVVDEALKRLTRDREKEGSFLFKDFTKRMSKIKKIVSEIRKNTASDVRSYKRRLSKRIKELSGGYSVDKGRLEIEVALFAKNSDVTEELTRLNNHITNFAWTVKKSGEVGKKLDFIAQELHREINTIGSKSSGFNVSKGVIEAKTEVEKIREQLKNIE